MKKYLLLFAVLLSLGASKVYAQCLPDTLPTNPACKTSWVSETTTMLVTVNGVTCSWTITYCWRTWGCISPTTDIYVVNVTVPTPPPCNQVGITPWGYLKIAGANILQKNPNNLDWPCPPCDPNSTGIINGQVYYGACYSGNIQCAAVAWCQNKYYLCCDPDTGERILTYIGAEAIGDCVIGGGCDTHCE